MRLLSSVLILGLLAYCSGCTRPLSAVAAPTAPGHRAAEPRVWVDPAHPDEPVRAEDVLARARTMRFLLLGEVHDEPRDHRLQAQMIRDVGGHRSVVFEMLDVDRQGAVDDAIGGQSDPPRERARRLASALQWERSGWPAWPTVEPVFVAALAGHHPLIAAGVPRRAFADAPPSATWTANLPPSFEREVPPELETSLRSQLRTAHCDQIPEDALTMMMVAQHLRDERMAERLLTSAGPDGAFLVAGTGHVRRGRGVPMYLAREGHTADVMVFGMVESTQPIPWSTYAGIYDYVFVTPPLARDHALGCKK